MRFLVNSYIVAFIMRNAYRKKILFNFLPASSIVLVRHKIKGTGYKIAPQYHPGQEIIYVDYGKLLLHLQRQTISLETGDCYIIPSNVRHHFEGEQGNPFDFLNIVYRGHIPSTLVNRVLHLLPDERRIMHTLKAETEAKLANNNLIVFLKLNELLLLLDRRKGIGSAEMLGNNRLRYRNIQVQKALNYLFNNLAKPLNAREVAHHVGISDSHLRLIIQKETRQSLRQHLRRFRIDFAKHLLRESSENIDAIAYKVGYHSPPHFCTVFKTQVKMTPSQYAKSIT